MANDDKTTYYSEGDSKLAASWVETDDFSNFLPCTQVRGVIFNVKREVLLIEERKHWVIPGGTPKRGESPEQTLKREVLEEAGTTILKSFPLGVHIIENFTKNRVFYQYRFVCLVDQLLSLHADPDRGVVHPRIFVPIEAAKKSVKWGKASDLMFDAAMKKFKNLYPTLSV